MYDDDTNNIRDDIHDIKAKQLTLKLPGMVGPGLSTHNGLK